MSGELTNDDREVTIMLLCIERLAEANPDLDPVTIVALVREHNGPELLREAIHDYQDTGTIEESQPENQVDAITKRLLEKIAERTPRLKV